MYTLVLILHKFAAHVAQLKFLVTSRKRSPDKVRILHTVGCTLFVGHFARY
jgi:hypothetical protein